MEMSSKKPVSRFREVVQVPKRVMHDPGFESLCGKLDVEGFKNRYDFLYKDNLPAEKEELKRKMKKAKDPEVINKFKESIAHIDRELKPTAMKQTEKDILAEHKRKEREAAKNGKRPYYLKKCDSPCSSSITHPHAQKEKGEKRFLLLLSIVRTLVLLKHGC